MTESSMAPIGHLIEDFTVLGEEKGAEEQIIAVDMVARTDDSRRWLINVVTKHAFLERELREIELATQDPLNYFAAMEAVQPHYPYLLNDNSLTEDVLIRKFRGRKVEADLAASMDLLVEPETPVEDTDPA